MDASDAFGAPRRGGWRRLFGGPDAQEATWAANDLSRPVADEIAATLSAQGIECEVREYVTNPTGRGYTTGMGSYASGAGDSGPGLRFGVVVHRGDLERAVQHLTPPPVDDEELARESEQAYRDATGREAP